MPRPVAQLVGGLMRAPFLRWAGRTTLEVLRTFTSNDDLIALLAGQWGNYGLPPAQSSFGIHAVVAGHYLNGGSDPVGGASRILDLISPLIERNGGQVVVGAEVAEVLTKRQAAIGVRMADGREFRSKAVISDAGARNTFERLVPAPNVITDALANLPRSMAHLSLYVGLKHTAAELGLSGTNLWGASDIRPLMPMLNDSPATPRRRSRCSSSPFRRPRIRNLRHGIPGTPPLK